jgi:hypothetical protein
VSSPAGRACSSTRRRRALRPPRQSGCCSNSSFDGRDGGAPPCSTRPGRGAPHERGRHAHTPSAGILRAYRPLGRCARERRPAEDRIAGFAGPLLESIQFVRQYSGPPLEEGRKSVSFRLTVGSAERTLSSEEAGEIRGRIIDGMRGLGYELRV